MVVWAAMAEQEKKPWYGKTCARCDAPINYAQAKKGAIPGYCGKCTDEVRRKILLESGGGGGGAAQASEPVPARRGVGARVAGGIIAGIFLGFAAAVALAAFAPGKFAPAVEALKKIAGRH
jgi:hypothetical protein